MKVVILAGGLGTRMREETEFRPKPMVEIGGQPIIWHIMKTFAHHELTDFVVCTGYKGNVIKEYFLNYRALSNDCTIHLGGSDGVEYHGNHLESDWRVTVVDTGAATNTGGRVDRVQSFIDGDTFIVTYGDGVADIDISALISFHFQHGRLATLTAVQPMTRFGIVQLADDGRVLNFREKPKSDDWVSAGFFVFDRAVFDYIAPNDVLEQEPLEALAKDGELMSYRHRGFWQPMDTFRELTLLNDLWTNGAPWKVWEE